MNKSLRDRIDLANQYIKFAMDRQIWGQGYFGASYPMLIEYTQPIKVTPSGNFVTVEYMDRASPEWPTNFSVHKERYNIHPGNVNSEERIGDLRYEISNYIINAIKNGAKDEGYELPKFNPRRRRNSGWTAADEKRLFDLEVKVGEWEYGFGLPKPPKRGEIDPEIEIEKLKKKRAAATEKERRAAEKAVWPDGGRPYVLFTNRRRR